MSHRIAILGASLGGLVAAAELRRQGCEVTIFEKGLTVGGLFSKAETPFGTQELGMHVIYAGKNHFEHLSDIFGSDSFHVLRGPRVDIGGSANFGKVYWGSHYPSMIGHPLQDRVLTEMLAQSLTDQPAMNAEAEAIRRFGPTAAHKIIFPILRKLWGCEPSTLSRHALHCFFDLRRIVVTNKSESDQLKENTELDAVIANPDQRHPKGEVFGGRMGLMFQEGCKDPSKSASDWARRTGTRLLFGADVTVQNGELILDGNKLAQDFDACIVTVPVHMLTRETLNQTDKVELSIYYMRLETTLGENFPSYYILAHDSSLQSSRIVNYESYQPTQDPKGQHVIAVEAIHAIGNAPTPDSIAAEVMQLQPQARITDTFQMSRSLTVLVPSLANGALLDDFETLITTKFGKPVLFTGMRTDTGIFFSHHTIGLAYDSALACIRKLH